MILDWKHWVYIAFFANVRSCTEEKLIIPLTPGPTNADVTVDHSAEVDHGGKASSRVFIFSTMSAFWCGDPEAGVVPTKAVFHTCHSC
jgi:hypothetical protein